MGGGVLGLVALVAGVLLVSTRLIQWATNAEDDDSEE